MLKIVCDSPKKWMPGSYRCEQTEAIAVLSVSCSGVVGHESGNADLCETCAVDLLKHITEGRWRDSRTWELRYLLKKA